MYKVFIFNFLASLLLYRIIDDRVTAFITSLIVSMLVVEIYDQFIRR